MFRIRYGKIIASCVALAVAALLVTVVLTHTGRAKPRPAPRPPVTPPANEVIREGIKPGNYATAINIHNPSLGGSELNTGVHPSAPQGDGHVLQESGHSAIRRSWQISSIGVAWRFVVPRLCYGNRLYEHLGVPRHRFRNTPYRPLHQGLCGDLGHSATGRLRRLHGRTAGGDNSGF